MVAAAEQQQQRRAVICLGDSHTRGFYGGSWLKPLRAQFPHLRFINAGNDGEPSASIAARLPALLQAYPDPAAVTIFSGSNDCIAQGSWQLGEYYRRKFGVSQCSEQQALDNLEDMLQLVHKEAPNAKVIVITLPIMVEDPRHSANLRALHYCNAVKQLVSTKYPAVALVDFQTACRQHMAQHSPKWVQALQEGTQPKQQQVGDDDDSSSQQQQQSSSNDSSYNFGLLQIGCHMTWAKYYQQMLRGRSWDAISKQQGLVLLTDNIHINDTAAQILAGLVQLELQSV